MDVVFMGHKGLFRSRNAALEETEILAWVSRPGRQSTSSVAFVLDGTFVGASRHSAFVFVKGTAGPLTLTHPPRDREIHSDVHGCLHQCRITLDATRRRACAYPVPGEGLRPHVRVMMIAPKVAAMKQQISPRQVHLFAQAFGYGAGMEQYGLALATELSRTGWQVFVHARKADVKLAEQAGVTLKLYSVPRFPRALQDYRFSRIVSKLTPSLNGIQFALTRVPVKDGVICGGTSYGYLTQARKLAGPIDWLRIWMEKQAYRSARYIVSSSFLCQRELMERYQVPEKKILVLHPALRDEFLHLPPQPDRAALRRQLGLPEDRVVFLFPSSGHKRKGLWPILRALKSVGGDAALAVTGRPPRGAASDQVICLGYVDRLADAYTAADFTTLGSYYEPFGQVGPESILCGTPLVFEKQIGALEVVRPEAVLTFDVHNEPSIAAAFQEAVCRAKAGQSRIINPRSMLTYDPSMASQAKAMMDILSGRD